MQTLRKPSTILLAALALGVCADRLFYGRWLGVSAPLFVALGLAALVALGAAEDRRPTRANLWLGAAALFFALCVAWRDSPALVALDTLAAIGLLVLLAATYRSEPLARMTGERAVAQTLAALVEIAFRPAPLAFQSAGQIRVERSQLGRLAPVARGLALALPVLACFTVLLMAADSVFASYVTQLLSLNLPFDITDVVGHTIVALFFAWLCAGGLAVALLSGGRSPLAGAIETLAGWALGLVRERRSVEDLPAEGATQRLRAPKRPPFALGAVEALTVLLAVDGLFASFMAIQGTYFFGGLDTLDRTGMTYAEYARRGFFELLAVACLALAMLCALAVATRRETAGQRRGFNAASAAMIALVLGLLGSAYQRMLLYEQAYGYTELRLYTHSFMIWLALALALFLLALLKAQPRVFALGGLVSALVYLAALNIANPEALIVRENVARYQASGKIDAEYLNSLSADAVPELAAAFGTLGGDARDTIADGLAWQRRRIERAYAEQGWPSWNLGRARALAEIDGLRLENGGRR